MSLTRVFCQLCNIGVLNRLSPSLVFSCPLFGFSGIPVPVGFDQAHVMYVWFDALTNYLTGIHALVRGVMWKQRCPR